MKKTLAVLAIGMLCVAPKLALAQARCNGAHLGKKVQSERLHFTGVGNQDVYNPTKPFFIGGRWTIAARVESRGSETDSEIRFFELRGKTWELVHDAPVFKLQDPFFTSVNGELVLGGVETYPATPPAKGLGYKTVFYRGKNIYSLTAFAEGPPGMKGIRLKQLTDGRIFVLTRPQGGVAGRGKIGYTFVRRLDDLGPDVFLNAKIFEGQFTNDNWGGANEIHTLAGGKIGVLGHIAEFDHAGNRHYQPMAFTIDQTGALSPIKTLLTRTMLDEGFDTIATAKRSDLWDVLYTGGLEMNDDGTAMLYMGVGDTFSYRARIPNPF